ncbi:MAG TPA: hypothetical protein VF729_08490 [Solirubrobacterales bacterium]
MSGSVAVSERVTRVTPFGARFWDVAAGQAVVEGLRVLHRDPAGRTMAAIPNRAGVWQLRGVPGLREVEYGAGDEAYWDGNPPRPTGTIEVVDPAGRFVPVSFVASLPARGVLTDPCSPAAASTPGVPLFPAPARPLPPGLAAIRAELEDRDSGEPAAFALLEAEVEAPGAPPVRARGIADRRGQVVVALPYPEPAADDGARPLSALTWTARLRLLYRPPGAGERADDLCRILRQAEGRLLSSAPPSVPVNQTTVAFGRESVVRANGGSKLLAAAEPPP